MNMRRNGKFTTGDMTRWYKDGVFHREDGPAVHWGDNEQWWLNGQLHREGAPAISLSSGYTAWYKNGSPHREDGPAIIYSSGFTGWYINGKRISDEDVMNGRKKQVKHVIENRVQTFLKRTIK